LAGFCEHGNEPSGSAKGGEFLNYELLHLTLMMMTEMDIETSVYNVHLTRLIAREDFIILKEDSVPWKELLF